MIVVLARDSTIEKVKWRLPYYDEVMRQKNLQDTGRVDEVVLGDLDDMYLPVRIHRPDIIVLGYDQEVFVKWLERLVFYEGLGIEIIRLEAYKPEEYKSSILRKKKNSQ